MSGKPEEGVRKDNTTTTVDIATEDNSSREMCAYCDTAITISSKFYNITNVGDHEYIGRRLNQLGPKKNAFCDRVCKRHYDLNLKRDKAQRQFNSKRERLPGIQSIFDQSMTSKKSRGETTNQGPQTLINEFPPPVQTNKWFHNVPSVTETPSFRPSVYPNNPRTNLTPWSWDNSGRTNENINQINEPVSPSAEIKETEPRPDTRASPIDLVANHMSNILGVFQSNTDITPIIDSIKLNGQDQNLYEAIDALCTHTYRTISKLKKEEIEKKNDTEFLQDSVRDLVSILLKKENREETLSQKDINTLFVDWVNLQKQKEETTNNNNKDDI